MEEKVNITIPSLEGNELTLREGTALPVKEPNKINLIGQIDAPLKWLQERFNGIDPKKSYIAVNYDSYTICLTIDEKEFYNTTVTGHLQLSKEFEYFLINTGHEWTTFELADFIRMNRSYFPKPNDAAELVTTLRNFQAKVDKEIQNSDDKRGNTNILRRQVVDSNLPKSFNIKIPIFKGMPRVNLECEVDINPDTFKCQLVSPQAEEIKQISVDDIITNQVDEIKKIAIGVVIINI